MKCCVCKRNIAAGVEAQKMIVEYLQADDTTKIFGFMMDDGPLSQATGRIKRGWHHKCYHAARKRAARGDAVTGKVLAGGPSAYEMHALGIDPADAGLIDTREYSRRLDRLHQVAADIGKAVGDLTVLEAFWGREFGVGYQHGHDYRLEMYQLRAHLKYAHGHEPTLGVSTAREHDRLHVAMQQQAIAKSRAADEEPEPPTRDWRDQLTADISGKDHSA